MLYALKWYDKSKTNAFAHTLHYMFMLIQKKNEEKIFLNQKVLL